MLLRLRVQGFKNLEDVTVRFGPLTCFVGHNGVGKSNIFDAIQFLKLLAEHPIQVAAAHVRKPLAGVHEPLDLFLDRNPNGRIRLEADLLVRRDVLDDFKRPAVASATLLTYIVAFRYRAEPAPRLELDWEELSYHKLGEAEELLGFPVQPGFLASTLKASRRGERFISTVTSDDGGQEVKLHQDGGSRGQPFAPGTSPQTVLGGTNTKDYPTVLAARREMSSWRFFQLEPSAMRSPDPDDGSVGVSEHGAGIAATLHALSLRAEQAHSEVDVCLAAVNGLREVNESIEELRVDRDRARNQLVLQARTRGDAGWLGPRSLSDGTLRFLALVTLKLDGDGQGVVALEEPENGIHPSRIPAMVNLLRDLVVDPSEPVGHDNPLRQVILNTHSPDVVRQLAEDELLWVDRLETARSIRAVVLPVSGGWRSDAETVSRAQVGRFIGGSPLAPTWLKGQMVLAFGTAS
jgi:predicted ATPase